MKNDVIAFIPARSGSKRLPLKNYLIIDGKSILKRTCETVLESSIFDEIIVSTDNLALAKEVIGNLDGVHVVERSEILSSDSASVDEVISDYFKKCKKDADICCIYATNILLKSQTLRKSHLLYTQSPASGLMGISRYRYKLGKALRKADDGTLTHLFPENSKIKTQYLEDFYVSNGTFYWSSIKNLRKFGSLVTPNQRGIEIDDLEVCDLDTKNDLEELKVKLAINESKS